MSETAVAYAADSDQALASLFGRPEDGVFNGSVAKEKSRRIKYWRKPMSGASDSGWITTGPDVQTDAAKYQQFTQGKRFQELPDRFGKEVAGTPNSLIHPVHRHSPGNEHRWLELFMKNGGLTYVVQEGDTFGKVGEYLMPASQIVALALHRRPGMKEARPDLRTAVDIECPYGCLSPNGRDRRLFSGLTEDEAQKSVDQHIVAVHRDALASRAVGTEISKQLANLGGGSNIDAATIAGIVAAVMQAMKPAEVPVEPVEPQPAYLVGGFPRAPAASIDWSNATTITDADIITDDVPCVDFGSMKRQELMAYAKQKGIPSPEGAMRMNTSEWLDYVRANE